MALMPLSCYGSETVGMALMHIYLLMSADSSLNFSYDIRILNFVRIILLNVNFFVQQA